MKSKNDIIVPIKVEVNSDNCNMNEDIDCVTKSQEMTKKHSTEQTALPGTPPHTVTLTQQRVRAEGLSKGKVRT